MNIKEDYAIRINTVKKHIEANIGKKLPLEELAVISNFSPFHFQRIFKEMVGETPKQYIKRIRLEAAAHDITLEAFDSMLEVAFRSGFSSLASFSKAFKQYYGISPDKFNHSSEKEKIDILHLTTNHQASPFFNPDLFLGEHPEKAISIQVEKLPSIKLVYYGLNLKDANIIKEGYQKIQTWAKARELVTPQSKVIGLLKDYPLFTPLEKCRFMTGISVAASPKLTDTVNYLDIPACTYASFKSKGDIKSLIKSITHFGNHWLPESGYKLEHRPALFFPYGNPAIIHPHDIYYQVYLTLSPK